ncbi:MAG: ClpXP protease specificity-enhancing factor [Nitrosomonas sp.]|nr:ClpXP protease specificity-enhancing factor [Nitrosomonas sp.]
MNTNNISSSKPYLVRSIYEWCIDNDLTPFMFVKVNPEIDIPAEYATNGEIVFNISSNAIRDLVINNELICFTARFNGIPRKLLIPINSVKAIFAKEVNQGIEFSGNKEKERFNENAQRKSDIASDSLDCRTKNLSKTKLKIIK